MILTSHLYPKGVFAKTVGLVAIVKSASTTANTTYVVTEEPVMMRTWILLVYVQQVRQQFAITFVLP